jgi:hypothetical protein
VSGRREHWRTIQSALERHRRHAGPSAEVRDGIGERVEVTLGAELVKAQVLEPRIARPPRPHLRLVPKGAKPALASLLAYAPMALASFMAVTVASGAVYVILPHQMQDRVRRMLHLPESNAAGYLSGIPYVVGPGQGESPPSPSAPMISSGSAPVDPATSVASQLSVLPAESLAVAEVATHRAVSHGTRRGASMPVRPEPVEGPMSPAPHVAPPLPTRDLSLGEESALIEQARAELVRGSGTGALQALTDHERRFPGGRMFELREALTIQALVQAGRREEAYWRAKQFRALFPESLMLPVIRSALNNEGP